MTRLQATQLTAVGRPHPGDPSDAPRPKKGTRNRVGNVRVSGPEWAYVAGNEKPITGNLIGWTTGSQHRVCAPPDR